jgi:hypothetical protein
MKRNVSVVCVCSAPNCCDTEQRSASQPGSVASGTPVLFRERVHVYFERPVNYINIRCRYIAVFEMLM